MPNYHSVFNRNSTLSFSVLIKVDHSVKSRGTRASDEILMRMNAQRKLSVSFLLGRNLEKKPEKHSNADEKIILLQMVRQRKEGRSGRSPLSCDVTDSVGTN